MFDFYDCCDIVNSDTLTKETSVPKRAFATAEEKLGKDRNKGKTMGNKMVHASGLMKNSPTKNLLDLVIRIVECGSWAVYTRFSDSPGFAEKHAKMRALLVLASKLHPELQEYLKGHISNMRRTLHMAEGDFRAAYEETMQNDPAGREIIEFAVRVMTESFRDSGIEKT